MRNTLPLNSLVLIHHFYKLFNISDNCDSIYLWNKTYLCVILFISWYISVTTPCLRFPILPSTFFGVFYQFIFHQMYRSTQLTICLRELVDTFHVYQAYRHKSLSYYFHVKWNILAIILKLVAVTIIVKRHIIFS